MKIAFVISAALLLCSCEPQWQEIERVEKALPAGCKFNDLGRVDSVRVFAVICGNRQATSTSMEWMSGKIHNQASVLWIGEVSR